jgi:GTP pyrophosphokinase
MRRKQIRIDALYDISAERILVDSVRDCYTALGIVHHLWTPLPGEFDDYIAKP